MTPLRLETEIVTIRTKYPFRIARGVQDTYRTVLVRVFDGDGRVGLGEAAPQRYYGETCETVEAAMAVYGPTLPDDCFALDRLERSLLTTMSGNNSARAALSTAFHDLAAQRMGVPLWRMWGLDRAAAPHSTFTIALDTPEVMRRKVEEAAEYPILKVKLGVENDREILETIRRTTDREIRVDANGGWSRSKAIAMLPLLEEFGVTVLEQPVTATDIEGLAAVTSAAGIPVIADESCLVASDIPRLVGAVDGINIKLAKTGGLREALKMIAVARAHHLMVMVGCMIETSVGISAMAHLTPLVDIADLDGAALLAHDPFDGASIPRGQITLPDRPGLGVIPRA
jgi:L-alanine-DL-glutamate epimerase-like enolase superfamily enzyme